VSTVPAARSRVAHIVTSQTGAISLLPVVIDSGASTPRRCVGF
jgi:hypothetical protein